MNILHEMLDHKRGEISHLDFSESVLKPRTDIRSLKTALSQPGISIIAEIKRKSPSEGEIFPGSDPVQIAKDYESAGAAAISVLTDKKFFGGSIEILKQVRDAVSIPVLRKDFIIDPRQIRETAQAGADACLLIADAMNADELKTLYALCIELGLEALVEFHGPDRATGVRKLNPSIVGVNSRNLKSMKTDILYFEKMVPELPGDSIKVAESGISTCENLHYISHLGYHGALIGTSLMKTGAPGKALEKLLAGKA